MSDDKRIISTQILEDTADAIREKLGTQAGITPAEFAENISQIGTPELQNKTVTPSTSQQTIIADDGYQGLDTVTVEAVDPSQYQKPEESCSVTPSTSAQTINPDTGKVFNQVNVSAVTSAIDANIVASNIKKDVNILGVTGSYEGSGGGGEGNLVVPNLSVPIKTIKYIDTTSSTTSLVKYIVPSPNVLKIKHAYIITMPNINGVCYKVELVAGTYQLFRTCDTRSTLSYGDAVITENANGKYISINGFTSLNMSTIFCADTNGILPSPRTNYSGYLLIDFDFEDSSVYNNILYNSSNTVGINFGAVTATSYSNVTPVTTIDKTVTSSIDIKLSELSYFNVSTELVNGVSTSILKATFINTPQLLRTS